MSLILTTVIVLGMMDASIIFVRRITNLSLKRYISILNDNGNIGIPIIIISVLQSGTTSEISNRNDSSRKLILNNHKNPRSNIEHPIHE